MGVAGPKKSLKNGIRVNIGGLNNQNTKDSRVNEICNKFFFERI
jgi:hypothetical protein